MSRRLKALTICICIQHLYEDIVRQRNIAESISCAGHFMNGSMPLECWSNFMMMREVKRFVDLTADETSDLWFMAKKVGSQLEKFHSATSLTFAIQDGPQAGQTVPHVHIHIIPRTGGDFEKNDEIYDAIDEKEKELKQKLDLDKERSDRSMEEMAQEADDYRLLFL
uniref:HIT domain-containing protein n=1 Tax=Populus alba TaxID=43335 RepID=A0A4U5MPJ2_POPAL|nr:hypothetical protein D5086_0000304170 [Populus alba]